MEASTAIPARESEERLQKESILLKSELRSWWVLQVMGKIEKVLLRWNVSPNAVSYLGMGLACACAALFATGHILAAGWMLLVTGSVDILDGRIARATNRVTRTGEFLDSSLDRYQDFLIFAALSFLFRDSWVSAVALAALGGTMIVSYVRAKADSMGVNLKDVGSMQRPERVFLLGFGSMVSSVLQIALMPFYGKGNPPPHLLIAVLILMAVSTNWTALKRIRHTMKALEEGSSER